ncbi:strawberry notch-like NTP hydrolase domain-containing protein, partial [Erythrobacter donghaensis]
GGVAGGEGARGTKSGSLQGIAGVLLQNNLPDARVLYASATGASEVNNLAYAVRLGLWGPGTAFANREDFISQIRAGGIAAMELV